MPFPGPQEQLLYSAYEAYNVIGDRRFEHEWTGLYSGKPALPDLALLRKLAYSGAELPDEARQFLEADSEEASAAQTQRRREEQGVNDLVDAIRWGKTEAWLRVPDWQLISPFDWQDGSEALPHYKALLCEDISAVAKDGKPDPKRLGITKRKLHEWAGYLTPIHERSLLVVPKPQPANRPPEIDRSWLVQEFHRLCAEGSVDINRQGWRLRAAEELARRHQGARPDAPAPKRGLQARAQTIRRLLKPEFDEYERSMKAD